jgi:membrane peptidoglycan carboxypeptidase
MGWTPQLAAGVWVGKPVPEPLQRITINGQYYAQVYGGTVPAPIWADITGPALAASPVLELPPPAVSAPKPAPGLPADGT